MKKKYIDDLDIMNAKDTVRIFNHCNGNCDQCPLNPIYHDGYYCSYQAEQAEKLLKKEGINYDA